MCYNLCIHGRYGIFFGRPDSAPALCKKATTPFFFDSDDGIRTIRIQQSTILEPCQPLPLLQHCLPYGMKNTTFPHRSRDFLKIKCLFRNWHRFLFFFVCKWGPVIFLLWMWGSPNRRICSISVQYTRLSVERLGSNAVRLPDRVRTCGEVHFIFFKGVELTVLSFYHTIWISHSRRPNSTDGANLKETHEINT